MINNCQLRVSLKLHAALTLLLLTAFAGTARAAEPLPFLHPLFSDNMVLQRDIAAPVWGWTEPGKWVTVALRQAGAPDQKPLASAKASGDAFGKWMVRLNPLPAGGPYDLTASGSTSVTLHNVMLGDVWLCSGQSNMQFTTGGAINAGDEIAHADHPNIRLFTVPDTIAAEPTETVKGSWSVCSPGTVPGFSAVGYFFGRDVHEAIKVPIGLIHSSWGGTIAEAWTSAQGLQKMPEFAPAIAQVREAAENFKIFGAYDKAIAHWYEANDPGSAPTASWGDPAYDAAAWKTMTLPTNWEAAGLPDFDGIVWFRKEFDAPAEWAGRPATLNLGPIHSSDTTWVNGTRVGAVDGATPRSYNIPAGLLKAGKNVIAVRVLDFGGPGGINGKAEQMHLDAAGAVPLPAAINLAGPWLYQASTPLNKTTPRPQWISQPNIPTVLYNAMIAPLLPLAIKGAIWYQGESNADRPGQYRVLLPALISDWRSRFTAGQFPFLIVQLANFQNQNVAPEESGWAELREAQALTAQRIPNAGLASAIDVGDARDIHPKNKQEVGRRLALNALAIAYHQHVEYSGPVYRSMTRDGDKLKLKFDHLGGGLVVKGDKLLGFAIAGANHQYVWADATVEGDTVVLSSPTIKDPLTARYDWANNPVGNLYNKAGLPAVSFRTDAPAS